MLFDTPLATMFGGSQRLIVQVLGGDKLRSACGSSRKQATALRWQPRQLLREYHAGADVALNPY